MIVRADLAHELGVNQNRESTKTFANEHRRTKVGEHPHENQQGSRQKGRHHQGQDNLPYPLKSRAA